MNENRRSHEASSLRTFFDDQIQYLEELAFDLSGYAHAATRLEEENQIIESFVDGANIKIRAARDYVEKLRVHVRGLYDHVLQVAEQIPAVVDLNKESFRTNPLVNSLFVNSEDIDRLFRTNPEVRAYLRAQSLPQGATLYGLLTACKHEKSMLGVGMLGDMLVREVPRKAVNFSSHKIHMPCDSGSALEVALKKYLFERVVHLIKQELASRTANQPFRSVDRSYESLVVSLANPDVYLNSLIEFIGEPAQLLRIEQINFKLSKLGIRLNNDEDKQCSNEFDICELTWSDNSKNVLVQVAYSR